VKEKILTFGATKPMARFYLKGLKTI